MTKVIAIETFTYKDNTVSMHKGQIAEIDDTIATELIADGYVEEYTQGGGGSGAFVVNFTFDGDFDDADWTTDKSSSEISDALSAGLPIYAYIAQVGRVVPLVGVEDGRAHFREMLFNDVMTKICSNEWFVTGTAVLASFNERGVNE